jgi:hypothetical protein
MAGTDEEVENLAFAEHPNLYTTLDSYGRPLTLPNGNLTSLSSSSAASGASLAAASSSPSNRTYTYIHAYLASYSTCPTFIEPIP